MWDPRAGSELATWHAHKAMVTQVQWNQNGNWLLSVSRDALAKVCGRVTVLHVRDPQQVWDMRMQREIGIFKGHARDVVSCDWHPLHEEVFATSAQDGGVAFWMTSRPNPQACYYMLLVVFVNTAQALMPMAHDSVAWSVAWHPAGHMLASGGGDAVVKFWCRPRQGDPWADRDAFLDEPAAAGVPTAGVGAVVVPGLGSGVIPGVGEAKTEAAVSTLLMHGAAV